MNRMSKTEIPAASSTNITSNASAISTATSSSTAQRTFLSKYRLHKKFVAAARVLLLVAFLSVWELTASHQIIDSFIFSSPSKIARCFLDMVADRSIFLHLGVTLYETIVSFLLVIVFSILTAVLLWFSKKLSEILEPYLVVLNSLPKSALAPLLIVWLGATRTTIIVAGMSVAIFGSILNLYTSFMSADPGKMTLIYTLGGKRHQVLTKVVLPSSIPAIFPVSDRNTIFRNASGDSDNIYFLKRIISDQMSGYLPRKAYQWYTVVIGSCKTCHKIRCPRSACNQTHSCFSG